MTHEFPSPFSELNDRGMEARAMLVVDQGCYGQALEMAEAIVSPVDRARAKATVARSKEACSATYQPTV